MTIIAVANGIVLFSIAYLLWKREDAFLKKVYWPALGFKLLCGIGLGLLYRYYYTVGDTYGYYNDGVRLAKLAHSDFSLYVEFLWGGSKKYAIWHELGFQRPRAMFMSKIASVLCLLTSGNYWIMSLYLSFISFVASWYLVKQIIRINASLLLPAVAGFLFLPSAVFWSSGLIKESVAMAALYSLITIFLKLWLRERTTIYHGFLVLLTLWILWNLKYYYLAVLLPILVTALVMKYLVLPRLKYRQWYILLPVWGIVFTLPLWMASKVHPNFYPERFMNVIVENYRQFTLVSSPGDFIVYPSLRPEAESILSYAPKALLSGLFRPFVWEAHTGFQFLVAMENLMLIVLLITSLARLKELFDSGQRLLFFSATVYSILLCIFLALSTPNYGTLSRYKTGFVSFVFVLVACNNPLLNRLKRFVQS
jgi:hypothetical protein